jgi:CRISPR-associated protein Csd1
MILQRLSQYYERKLAEKEIAPPGYAYVEIHYLIVIDEKGKFLRFESNIIDEKEKQGRKLLVPAPVRRTNGVKANLLWDNASYILGLPDPTKESEPERLQKQQAAFRKKVEQLASSTGRKDVLAVATFLSNIDRKVMERDVLWPEIKNQRSPNLTFKLNSGNNIPASDLSLLQNEAIQTEEKEVRGLCLITGETLPIARLHPSIKGVNGTNTTGGSLVSFNLDAFESFGYKQGYNAPISRKAAFAYTTALNTLLSSERRQRMSVGDTTIVFWGEKESELEKDAFSGLFNDPEHEKGRQKEAELQRLESLRFLLDSPKSGRRPIDEETSGFYVLGLGPNSARISIRFWYEGSVAQTAANLRQYFQDLQIVKPEYESGFLSLKRLLRSTAVREEEKNIVPEMTTHLFQAILRSEPFPRIVLDRALARIKADHSEFAERNLFPRVALIKAYLNRMGRTGRIPQFKEVTTDMDEENQNIGYNLGRFFAVLERAQEAANPGINTTIRDRYFTSACTRPGTVFPVLVNLSMHHVSKVGGGLEVYFEKLKAKVLGNVSRFPLILSLEDQGYFALGYYHQRQAFFTKKEGGEE